MSGGWPATSTPTSPTATWRAIAAQVTGKAKDRRRSGEDTRPYLSLFAFLVTLVLELCPSAELSDDVLLVQINYMDMLFVLWSLILLIIYIVSFPLHA